ncbi:MAG: Ig-like domain-containing protein, partial [Candidatus Thiodiazotropha sp.]
MSGLKSGDRSYTDMVFPFEYLIDVPYGQAGTDLTLSASATEKRQGGDPRTVDAPAKVTVHILKDEEPPEVQLVAPPESGTTVAEKRPLPFNIVARDNVRVASVRAVLYADLNQDGNFADGEQIADRLMLSPPYTGTQAIRTIAEYLSLQADDPVPAQLAMQFQVTAKDEIGNQTRVEVPVQLVGNQPPEVNDIRLLDSRGFSMGDISEITEGRGIVVNVVASDPEVGVDATTLYYAIGPPGDPSPDFVLAGEDAAAPFQFHIEIPVGKVGQVIRFRAMARDMDGYESPLFDSPRQLTIKADEPPTANLVKPANSETVVIEGQNIDVAVEVFDDLGPEGVERVVFYVNGQPAAVVYDSVGRLTGSYAQDHVFEASLAAPEGVDGFTLQAIAYDVLGQAGESQVVTVGKIADTVVPKVSVLYPLDREVLTTAEPLRAVVSVEDIGAEAESVSMLWQREYRDSDGSWKVEDEYTLPLTRDDTRVQGDTTPVSDPDKHYLIYWADFSDGSILRRGNGDNERLHVTTTVVTPNHTVNSETFYEVGLPISERRFIAPAEADTDLADTVYYTSIQQYRALDREGAMIAAWANTDPMRVEQGLGNATLAEGAESTLAPRTGIFIMDAVDETEGDQSGNFTVYSSLLNGAAEIFAGTIGEITADENLVLAAKSGLTQTGSTTSAGGGFVGSLSDEIKKNWDLGADLSSGGLYLENSNGELLIFNMQNGEAQFGIPYKLAGRIDLPYPDVYGLARKDDLALIANGYGGVQVIDISNLNSPYHVGYIKPDGFARDVKIKGRFAYIAASHQGVVVADVSDPALPIVAYADTLGVANRLQIVGDKLYVTDMAGDGGSSRLNVLDIADPYHPQVVKTVELQPARPDLVSDGVYDVHVSGNLAYVTVHYSDQEDKPAQSLVEIIDLGRLGQTGLDVTVPVMIHRQASESDFAARDITLARGAIQVAAGRAGVDRVEMPALTVLDHEPYSDQANVSTQLDRIRIELSAVLPADAVLGDYFEVLEGDPQVGLPVTDKFDIVFATRGENLSHRIVDLQRRAEASLERTQRYYVRVKAGLTPLTGQPLAADYLYAFSTAIADGAAQPDITAICTSDSLILDGPCIAAGDVSGGTEIVVSGYGFGDAPKLGVGGQPLVIQSMTVDQTDGLTQLHAKTVPNYAGPAAVSVTNASQLTDT